MEKTRYRKYTRPYGTYKYKKEIGLIKYAVYKKIKHEI